MFSLKRPLLILALISIISISASPQCTLTNLKMVNTVISGNTATFSLSFIHVRNSGNKWITIHLWDQAEYPAVPYNYNHDGVPTSLSLDGMDPQGTIIIDNSVVNATGTYTSTQAFALTYQNDASFAISTSPSSVLSYNASTNTYLITHLSITFPHSISTIEGDVWSSQADHNQTVACYLTGLFPVVILPVTGMETFAVETLPGKLSFSWTLQTEHNNDHFEIQKSYDGADWMPLVILGSKFEDGNSEHPSSYSYQCDKYNQKISSVPLILMCSLLLSVLVGLFKPRVGTVLIVASTLSLAVACKKSTIQDATLRTTFFRLKQVDKDGNTSYSPVRTLKL